MPAIRLPSILAVRLALACVLLPAGVAAQAADWAGVVAGRFESVEFDRSRTVHAGSGTTGWSRILLGREVRDPGGAYDQIHAQNQYDCAGRRFTTLRRAYFLGNRLVREEAASRQRANAVQPGSIDERLLNEACASRPASADAGLVASLGRALQEALDPERPAAMHADMRSLGDGERPRLAPVADATTRPATSAAAPAAAATAAPTPSGEKPRHIVLPAIDKAAADAAAAAVGGKPATPPPPAAAAKSPAKGETKPVARPDIAATAKAAGTAPAAETLDERRLRELQYATSGPRRAAARKPADTHAAAKPHVHWSYEGEGAPTNWGKLKGEYAACSGGQRQSPIDIRDGIKVSLEAIRFEYKPTAFRIVDNGHTLQASVGEGLALHLTGKRYELVQLHFHRPGEERVNGRTFDMSVHLVHRNDEGQLAVVAVLLEKGSEHPLVQTLWNNMPLEKNLEVAPLEAIDPAQLLPENRAYWTYMGSLTTPPCTEGVLWLVMKQPMQVSADQVAIFSRLYRNNARPVQAANGRLIKESR